ncbi:MAG: M12 family metallopeptidase, partial [Acidobacteriota bacterium]
MPKIKRFPALFCLFCVALRANAQEQLPPIAIDSRAAGVRDFRTLTFGEQSITVHVVEGMAIAHGDILLGPIAELETAAIEAGTERSTPGLKPRAAVYINSLQHPVLWTDATAYYKIDSAVPNQQRILDAVAHWNAVTSLKILPYAGQPNYITFVRSSSGCSSSLGMVSGGQVINTGDGCSSGNMIHEIGHAFGLQHEQVRNDRNTF